MRGVRARVPEFAGMPAGASVLDVCCGTGAQAYIYARQGLKATGIDLDPSMLHQSEVYLRSADFALVEGDARNLPFPDRIFDYVSISWALHDKDRAMQEAIIGQMKRVVKTGGGLVFLDYSAKLPRDFLGLSVRLLESAAGRQNRLHFWAYLASGGLPGLLERAGLRPVKAEPAGRGVLFLTKCGPGVCQEPPPS
jgi:ubiquinone/menaquinone biosynthesis C-methylase UbiE